MSRSAPSMVTGLAHLGLLDDEEIEIDLAALELSALDHEGVDLAPYVAILRNIGDRLASIGGTASTGIEQGEAVAYVIGGKYGFAGDRATYDAPLNADMIRVIDRRKGLPVSLSILYVAAARRMGWTAHALNTPGHVLVRIGPETSPMIIDPFNGGTAVESEQLAALLSRMLGSQAFPSDDHLSPMSNRAVLVRLLINQASRAEQAGDIVRARTIYERMTAVAPSNGPGWWDLARLQLATGDVEAARGSLSAMLEMTRDAERRGQIVAALDAISGR